MDWLRIRVGNLDRHSGCLRRVLQSFGARPEQMVLEQVRLVRHQKPRFIVRDRGKLPSSHLT